LLKKIKPAIDFTLDGFGPMDLDQWIWTNGFGPMDLDQWIWTNGFGPMDSDQWIWINGFGPMKTVDLIKNSLLAYLNEGFSFHSLVLLA
jgi:hypothetical protein